MDKPKIVVVMAVSPSDWHRAIKWMKWTRMLDAKSEDHNWDLMIFASPFLDPNHLQALIDCPKPFCSWALALAEGIKKLGYFGEPNQMFEFALRWVEKHFPGRPMLWAEADTVPMCPDWVGWIQKEYDNCGKPFMGQLVLDHPKPHMNGNGVYPPDWRLLAPSLASLRPEEPHDTQCAHEILSQASQGVTIRQVWRPPPFTRENWRDIVPGRTALFHQCRDGTLIDVLCEELGYERIDNELPLEPSSYELPKVHILTVSCRKHLDFCRYLVRSYKKFCTGGITGMTVVVPYEDEGIFKGALGQYGVIIRSYYEAKGKEFLHHQVVKCEADIWVPDDTQVVLHADSDCVFTRPFHVGEFFRQGRPWLPMASFESLKWHRFMAVWKGLVDYALGGDHKYETMRCHPELYHVDLYKRVREHIEKRHRYPFTQYVLLQRSEFPQTFAEFPTLGAYALDHDWDRYAVIDLEKEGMPLNPLRQNWTTKGIETYRAELDKLLA